jgi:spore maturation protein CgeB
MRIMIMYPGAEWSVYDVARGYETALANLGHEVRPFNYHLHYRYQKTFLGWLCQTQGMKFPADAACLRATEASITEIVEFAPQLLFIVSGLGWHRRGYDLAYRLGIPMVFVCTESPYMDAEQYEIVAKGHISMVFTNDRVSVPVYEDLCPTYYLPHSFDPTRHYRRDVGLEYQTDVFFWGTLWAERRHLLGSLDLSAYRAKVGGAYTDPNRPDVLIGEIMDNEEMALWYSGTKLALNHHRKDVFGGGLLARGDAYSLGPRAFEIAAMGAFQLCDDTRPELRDVFGDSIATYADAEECQDKIDYYLTHDAEREGMAQAAWRRVQSCSFEQRANQIVIPALERLFRSSRARRWPGCVRRNV